MRITDSVERIDGTMANTYVVRNEGKIILVDAGMKSSAKKIIEFFDSHSEKPDAVLITHYHPDHIGGLSQIVKKYGSEVYAHQNEVDVIRGVRKLQPAKSLLSKMVSSVSKSEPVEQVENLDNLPFGWIRVVETQGHTPGSTSYLFEPENLLFVGDAVTVKGGKTSLNKQFTLDMAEAQKSQQKILSMKGATILPGHGDPLRIE